MDSPFWINCKIAQVCCNAICTCICLPIVAFSLYHLCGKHSKIRIKSMKYFSSCSIIFLWITCLTRMLADSAELSWVNRGYDWQNHKLSFHYVHGMNRFSAISWLIGTFCGYMFFFNRLYITFKDTTQLISQRISHSYYTLLCLFALSGSMIILFDILGTNSIQPWSIVIPIHVAGLWILGIIDIFVTIFLIHLFTSKLLNIITDSCIDDNPSQMSVGHSFSSVSTQFEHNYRNHKSFVKLMSKFWLLTIFGVIAKQLSIIMRLIANIITLIYKIHNIYFLFYTLWVGVQAFDCLINIIAISMVFRFSGTYYNKCCDLCHKMCYRLMINIATTRIKHHSLEIQNYTQLNDMNNL
eukprot:155734_1